MEQALKHYDLGMKDGNVENVMKKTNNAMQSNSGEKSNKCNQCDYATSKASHLRIHLKMHSGEKPNKCNQCDYASFKRSNLRTHLKDIAEKQCNHCDYASFWASGKHI